MIQRTELLLQDEFVNFDDVTLLEDSTLFRFKAAFPRPQIIDETLFSVSLEYDSDLHVVERSFTTMIDILADVGGLDGALLTIFSMCSRFLNHTKLDNFLISQLYTK